MIALAKTLLLALFSITILVGCREDEKVEAYRQLRELPTAELERRVLALSPQEQVDMYVLAISNFKPYDTQLAPVLAKQGARILPAVVAELDKGKVSPQPLVLVLNMMVVVHHVNEAKQFAPRVNEWCSRYYKVETFCHEMGREMTASK